MLQRRKLEVRGQQYIGRNETIRISTHAAAFIHAIFLYHLCCLNILQFKWLFQKSRKGRREKYVTNGEEIAIQPKLPHAFPRAQLEE